jgi:hypothetical protein
LFDNGGEEHALFAGGKFKGKCHHCGNLDIKVLIVSSRIPVSDGMVVVVVQVVVVEVILVVVVVVVMVQSVFKENDTTVRKKATGSRIVTRRSVTKVQIRQQ